MPPKSQQSEEYNKSRRACPHKTRTIKTNFPGKAFYLRCAFRHRLSLGSQTLEMDRVVGLSSLRSRPGLERKLQSTVPTSDTAKPSELDSGWIQLSVRD